MGFAPSCPARAPAVRAAELEVVLGVGELEAGPAVMVRPEERVVRAEMREWAGMVVLLDPVAASAVARKLEALVVRSNVRHWSLIVVVDAVSKTHPSEAFSGWHWPECLLRDVDGDMMLRNKMVQQRF